MKNLLTIILTACSFLVFSQDYKVQKVDSEILLYMNNSIEGRYYIEGEGGVVGNYIFESGSIKYLDSVVGKYDDTKLYLNDRIYKFKTPAFSSYNKVVDKTEKKIEVFKLFQESKNNVVVSSEISLDNADHRIIRSWALFNQMKDIEKSSKIDIVTPIVAGALAGFLLTSK